MNLLEESIICKSCQEILKEPVVLFCGHSICKTHVDKAVEENEKQMKCDICDESFDIPSKGFVRNRALESLLDREIDELDLGEEYNSTFDKCSQFKELLEHFNRVKNDPELRIHKVLSDLRNKVDLRREELKQDIDKEALKMIEKIDDYEKDCKASIKSDSKLGDMLIKWESDLKQSQDYLDTFKRNNKKWVEISNETISRLKELQSEYIKFNKNLFLNRLDELNNSNLFALDSHIITMEIKELSKYRNFKEEKVLNSHMTNALGIQWILQVNIRQRYNKEKEEEKEDNKCDICIILGARQTTNVKIDFDVEILDQFEMGKSWKKNLIGEFNSIRVWSRTTISLEDIMENYNLYNIAQDSFMVQANIKKIERI